MKMHKKNESAVSPVVGVMLMLVATIIIAAVVSAFAGGMVSGTSKTPQATIQGAYSQSKGMTITHSGGDAIPLGTTTIYVRPTKSFGNDADKYSWQIDKAYVFNNQTNWANSRVFLPGDTGMISLANLSHVQVRPDGTITDYSDTALGFANSNNIGLSFVIEFQDAGGKSIGQGTVIITG
jgi:archaeal type IV pilus assembly protein PilA